MLTVPSAAAVEVVVMIPTAMTARKMQLRTVADTTRATWAPRR
jgi:hypothetical protein